MSKHQQDFPKHGQFCQMHDGIYTTIPREYVYSRDIKAREPFVWVPLPDGLKIQFVDRDPDCEVAT
jgi:hypothetical protein